MFKFQLAFSFFSTSANNKPLARPRISFKKSVSLPNRGACSLQGDNPQRGELKKLPVQIIKIIADMEATNSIPAQQEVAAAKSSSQSSVSRRISCVVCQQRKVKCDKQYPCSACERGHATCIYRTPAPPRRRKGRRELGSAVTETNLVARLKRYEELLRRLGVRLEDGDPTGGVGALNIHEDSSTVPKTEEVIVRDSELRSNTDERQGTIVGGNGAGKLVSGDGKSRLFER